MNRSRVADLGLLLVAMMWGSTFLIVQHAVRVLPPLAFNGIRFLGAGLLLAIITTLFYRREWKELRVGILVHASLLGVFLFLGYAFQTVGLLYTTTSNAGFITGLSVILVPFLALFLLRHPISSYTWLSALLAAIGLYLLAFAGSAFALNRGDFLVFLCAIAFALHVAYTAMYAPKYPALLLATLQMTVVGLLSLGSSLLFEDIGPIHQLSDKLLQPEVLWALFISIGPTSALAFWIQTVCQKFTSPSRVAIIFATEPVFAAITGVLFGGEVLGIVAMIGCLCIFTGMIMAELKSSPSTLQSI
ncbi:DMT family transporter [Paenibacillus sp. IHBB 10380]|uniref:DMT family transporter n=1 Tax=Paenibacillus sp. IHBB 10380 TaxID=1566358 RepID=UPI0005DA4031|nr:DMT family transporter [Paenibacillus sp. IHBB 10380]AJS59801.1 membrane protein [Paenibacillus sp. IHBB 10380]